MNFLLVSLISVLAFSSCATTAPKVDFPPFNYEETKRAMRAGKNTVKGSGFLRQAGGGIVKISGNSVLLAPVTEYSSARIRAFYGNVSGAVTNRTPNSSKVPPAYVELCHKTIADVDGRFEFNNVADGSYFCITHVSWRVNDRYNGGYIMKRVDVSGGKTVSIVVSGR